MNSVVKRNILLTTLYKLLDTHSQYCKLEEEKVLIVHPECQYNLVADRRLTKIGYHSVFDNLNFQYPISILNNDQLEEIINKFN